MSTDPRSTPRWAPGRSAGRGWPDDLVRAGHVPAPAVDVLAGAVSRLREAVAAEPAGSHQVLVLDRAGGVRNRATRRRTALFAVATTAAALAAILLVDAPWAMTTQQPEVVATGRGAVPLAQDESADCAVSYPQDLTEGPTFAFDGTISSIDAGGPFGTTRVTFEVDTWFRGPDTDPPATITLPMSPPGPTANDQSNEGNDNVGAPESSPPSYTVGTRLLVAGASRFGGGPLQDPVVWGCDFTRYYDQPTAQQWDAAFH